MTDDLGLVKLSFQSYDLDAEFELPTEPQVIQGTPSFKVGIMHVTVSVRRVLDQIDREVLLQYLGQDWIPVGERMPESGRRVLTYCPNTYVPYRISIHTYHVNYADAGPFWIGDRNYPVDKGYITHWAEIREGPDADL